MGKVTDNPRAAANANKSVNFVADVLASGTPQHHALTPEQEAAFRVLKANAQPPTEALRRAAARPRRFKFVPDRHI